ncbi:helix-turn-helix domain-containing protein [Tardiphaga sp. vice352]|uniref:helix-turn-helix domain-containing protein n=1 Tax=Tardiphaga sp. vice352 TaxID=2592816 RepID=UPI001163D63F|nr:helix-turn-helix domain-containing protein [Tardiphaga sp. vice352]
MQIDPPTAANDNVGPLGRIYTFDEAAKHLGVSKRQFQNIVKRHPFYAKNGNRYLFSETDIRHIWSGMRCDSISGGERPPRTGSFGAPTPPAGRSTNLQKRLTKLRPRVCA